MWRDRIRLGKEKLSRREKAVLAGGFLISGLCLFCFGWWQPHLAREKALQAELAAQARTAEYLSALEKNLYLYHQKKLFLLQEEAKLAEVIPPQPDTAVYLRWLEKEAETAGVQLLKAAGGGRASKEGFEEQVLQLTVQGDYEKIAAFAGRLENLPRLTGVRKVLLRRNGQQEGSSSSPGAGEKGSRGSFPATAELWHSGEVASNSSGEVFDLEQAQPEVGSDLKTAQGAAAQGAASGAARESFERSSLPVISEEASIAGAAPVMWEGVLEIVIWRDLSGAEARAGEEKENTSPAEQEK